MNALWNFSDLHSLRSSNGTSKHINGFSRQLSINCDFGGKSLQNSIAENLNCTDCYAS